MKTMRITNFKGYSNKTTINFSQITINLGLNSVGKSTVTQAILLIKQLYEKLNIYNGTNIKNLKVVLNGYYNLQLGSSNNLLSDINSPVILEIDDLIFNLNKTEEKFCLQFIVDDYNKYFNKFPNKLYYINAERLGPRNYQNIHDDEEVLCGYFGENTFYVIEKNRNQIIEEARRRKGDKFNANILSKQLEYWMDYIIPDIQFNTYENEDTRTAKLKIRQTTLDTEFSSPSNYGFGISYVLPIIVSGLMAEKDSILIVENPEAHLHPSGQSRIGQFLAQVAFSGVNVIIETHSEHLLNGVRLYSLKNKITNENICINYFSIKEHSPIVEKINLDNAMNILDWPVGFFDQEENDLAQLRRLRRI